MKQNNNIVKTTGFLVSSIFLFLLLYLVFFAIGGVMFYYSIVLFKFKIIHGYYQYHIPTPLPIVLFLGSIVLLFKMLESLFEIKQINRPDLKKIKRDDYPQLFSLIEDAANNVQVSPPGHVYLSATVSASVFIETGFLNIFRPARKQLEIGMGLINVLNTEELRAVLTHELGHFSQKSLGLKVPVYIISQNVQYLLQNVEVKKRGTFEAQSYIFIYLFRSLNEWMFSKLNKNFDSFITELEYDADEIAIKQTGSLALISALFKVSFANQLFDFTVNSLHILAQNNKKISDFYIAQLVVINSFLELKNNRWNDNFISNPFPDTNLSTLSLKRIEKLRSLGLSKNNQAQIIPATDLFQNYEKECVQFTESIYRYQINLTSNNLSLCNIASYQKWITLFFQQSEDYSIYTKYDVEIEIIMKKQMTFEAYLDEKRLGWYKRKNHIKTKTATGKHYLKINGDRFHKTLFEIDTNNKGKYIVYLDTRFYFRKFVHVILLSRIVYISD